MADPDEDDEPQYRCGDEMPNGEVYICPECDYPYREDYFEED